MFYILYLLIFISDWIESFTPLLHSIKSLLFDFIYLTPRISVDNISNYRWNKE
jgi:hypothetical protein